MNKKSLISPNIRREAREYMVGWALGQIGDVFHDHGLSADTSFDPPVSGQRRSYVEQFYRPIDWTDRRQIEQVLGVFEAILDDAESAEDRDAYAAAEVWSHKFARMLLRDGFVRDETGRLRPQWATTTSEVVDGLSADSAIPVILRRMWDSVESDPDAAIGAAKDAIEATAKHVLDLAGESVASGEKMPKLVSRAQDALGVHAKTIDPSKPSATSIQPILGALSQVALGVNDLRRDYGTGHGRPKRAAGLSPRHARLAAQAADAWVHFMLDTDRARSGAGR